ncbi:DNA-3-methyladenine glycosylase family protein [Candidatus Methylacidithermus pantelleriae]|uniref:DNA-(apurinic or apyrimidinic site) lyase n=1 Tax=Candidatus Methylacidithermus pantelleriae TaxID=2744239 RepID=A0A8J2BIJ6_9BACT|nr:DNA glycosylase [Candidatus Methylacidithermus pantelleriae]CAF0694015.1 ENDO3c domain-containing protein [Candidatus Methylacidithermus pantelleriae]
MTQYGLPELVPVGELSKEEFSPQVTFHCGQTFGWTQLGSSQWFGWVERNPCIVIEGNGKVTFLAPAGAMEAVARYFCWDVRIADVLKTFPKKDRLLWKAAEQSPGLRLLHQDPWETLAAFLLSSAKPIPEIEKLFRRLAVWFGTTPYCIFPPPFPSPEKIASAEEKTLRTCGVGYRARYLYRAAVSLAHNKHALENLCQLTTDEARSRLMSLEGVGPKIADCVLLFAYRRWEVFPVDRWIGRVLTRYYRVPRRTQPQGKLESFLRSHFGPYAGWAQQYLFVWSRKNLA